MPSRIHQVKLDKTASPFRRALQHAYYDWTREMPRSKRLITIPGNYPENCLRDALSDNPPRTISNLKSLVDPKLNEDDVTILLVKRTAGPASSGVPT